jgi:hypothetical protein
MKTCLLDRVRQAEYINLCLVYKKLLAGATLRIE